MRRHSSHDRATASSCLPKIGIFYLIFTLILVPLGCSTLNYQQKADDETYSILDQKSPLVLGMPTAFDIAQDDTWDPLDGLPRKELIDETLGDQKGEEEGAAIISLEHALLVAVRNSRDYQNQKETLYLAALSLTDQRYQFSPRFRGTLQGNIDSSVSSGGGGGGNSEQTTQAGIASVVGAPGALIAQYTDLVKTAQTSSAAKGITTASGSSREYSSSANTTFGVTKLLKGGGQLALNLSSNFFRFLSGDPSVATDSSLLGAFTQPLLRGAGRKIAAEGLTQAERDVLYAIRDFTRFRKTFVVGITSAYYTLLQNREVVRNNYKSYQSNQSNTAQTRALNKEGRTSTANLGLQEQSEFAAYANWISAITSYLNGLDNFRIQLGLSTDTKIVLDDTELASLLESGLQHPDIAAEDAVLVALASRLDFYNDRDRVDDAGRRVNISANALKPGLDFVLSATVPSTGMTSFNELVFDRTRYNAGLTLDLPFDRKIERNNYRQSLITLNRAARNYTLAEDNIKRDVRSAWRELNEARINYDIQVRSLALSERRVQEQDILGDLGRAIARDQIDAQNDLTNSQNGLIRTLVSHTLTRLQFWQDMGILFVKEDGQWEDIVDDYAPAQDLSQPQETP